MLESDFDKILTRFPNDPNLRSELKLVYNEDSKVDTDDDEELGKALAYRTRLWIQWHTFLLIISFGIGHAIAYAIKNRHNASRNIYRLLKEAKALRKKFLEFKSNTENLLYKAFVSNGDDDEFEGETYESSHSESPIGNAIKNFMGRKKEVVEKSIKFEENLRFCVPLENGNYLIQNYNKTIHIINPQKDIVFTYEHQNPSLVIGSLETEDFIFITLFNEQTNGCETLRFEKENLENEPYTMIHSPAQRLAKSGDFLFVSAVAIPGEFPRPSKIEKFHLNFNVLKQRVIRNEIHPDEKCIFENEQYTFVAIHHPGEIVRKILRYGKEDYQLPWSIIIECDTIQDMYTDDDTLKVITEEHNHNNPLEFRINSFEYTAGTVDEIKVVEEITDATDMPNVKLISANENDKYEVDHSELIVGLSNGTFAVRSTDKKSVNVWSLDIDPENPLATFNEFSADEITYMISYESNLIVASNNNTITVWNVDNQHEETTLIADRVINLLALSSDNKYLAAGAEDGSVYIYDLENNKMIRELQPGNKITALKFNHNDQLTCSIMARVEVEIANEFLVDQVLIWDIPEIIKDQEDNYRKRLHFANPPERQACKQLKDGNFIIQSGDNSVKIIDKHNNTIKELSTVARVADKQDGKNVRKLKNFQIKFRTFAEMEDGTIIGAGEILTNHKAALFLWRKNDTQVIQIKIGKIETLGVFDNIVITTSQYCQDRQLPPIMNGMKLNPSNIEKFFTDQILGGQQLASGNKKPYLVSENMIAYNPDEYLQLRKIDGNKLVHIQIKDPVYVERMLKLNDDILLIAQQNKLLTYSTEGQYIFKEQTLHESNIRHLAVSPNGKYFASADADGNILVWDAKKFELIGFHETKSAIIDLFISDRSKVSAAIPVDGDNNHISHIEFFKKCLSPEKLSAKVSEEENDSTETEDTEDSNRYGNSG